MTATSNFLVPNATFIVELVAFLIVLAVLGKFVLPPLNSALRARQEKIAAELSAADQARTEAAQADDERRQALEEARRRARDIMDQASRTAEQVRAEATARGEEEHARIVAGAAAEVAQARQRALEEATTKMSELVLDVVERIIGREVDAEAHRDLLDEAIAAVITEEGPASAAGTPVGGTSS